MKKFLLVGVVAIMASCATAPKDEWALVWEDNFDVIDTDVWTKIPRGGSDWNNFMSDYDSLYEVKNGELMLHGIKNSTQKTDTASYITGGIYTKNKKGFKNGRVEIRAKFTSAQGFWPAIWMMPTKPAQWPMGGEIDIMEHLNFDAFAYQTVHSNFTLNHGETRNPKSGITHGIDKNDWNVYAVELGYDTLKFFINGVQTNAYPRIQTDVEGQFPFAEDFYLKIDAQLGGGWVGKIDPTQLPATLFIDWVKFYQKNEQK